MEFPSFSEGTAFVTGLLGVGSVAGYPETGEGLVCGLVLLAVCGVLSLCAKIGNQRKGK